MNDLTMDWNTVWYTTEFQSCICMPLHANELTLVVLKNQKNTNTSQECVFRLLPASGRTVSLFLRRPVAAESRASLPRTQCQMWSACVFECARSANLDCLRHVLVRRLAVQLESALVRQTDVRDEPANASRFAFLFL